jgi:hypothetical protein
MMAQVIVARCPEFTRASALLCRRHTRVIATFPAIHYLVNQVVQLEIHTARKTHMGKTIKILVGKMKDFGADKNGLRVYLGNQWAGIQQRQ